MKSFSSVSFLCCFTLDSSAASSTASWPFQAQTPHPNPHHLPSCFLISPSLPPSALSYKLLLLESHQVACLVPRITWQLTASQQIFLISLAFTILSPHNQGHNFLWNPTWEIYFFRQTPPMAHQPRTQSFSHPKSLSSFCPSHTLLLFSSHCSSHESAFQWGRYIGE